MPASAWRVVPFEFVNLPSAGPVDKRGVEKGNHEFEYVFEGSQSDRTFQVENSPPNDQAVDDRVDALRDHGGETVSQPEVFIPGGSFQYMKQPDVEGLADQIREHGAEDESWCEAKHERKGFVRLRGEGCCFASFRRGEK